MERQVLINEWVTQHAANLLSWARYRVNDDEVAQDLVQETFLAAIQQFGNFRHESSALTWLQSILRNKIADHFRKQAQNIVVKPDHPVSEWFDDAGNWLPACKPTIWQQDEENLLDNSEFQQALINCLDELPESWAACMKLRYLEEKKAAEICQELRINPTNYWQIIHRSKMKLRICLENTWFRDPLI
ncbi:MAG: sigma-70 family RNA polymerase sigma factor [Cyclobacteriaceae bacterium]|nr:sigma-70 family RNA polymerase sigma factor [Cyclobacteriaceae bacterium]